MLPTRDSNRSSQVVRNVVVTYGSAERIGNILLSYRSTEESSPTSEGSSSVDTQESEAGNAKRGISKPGITKAEVKDVCKRMKE